MVIQLKDDAEVQLISSVLKKMRIQSKVLTIEVIEDIGLGEMMLKVDRSKKVSRELVMNKPGTTHSRIGSFCLPEGHLPGISMRIYNLLEKAGISGLF